MRTGVLSMDTYRHNKHNEDKWYACLVGPVAMSLCGCAYPTNQPTTSQSAIPAIQARTCLSHAMAYTATTNQRGHGALVLNPNTPTPPPRPHLKFRPKLYRDSELYQAHKSTALA